MLRTIAVIALAVLLTACGSDIYKRAYVTGQTYSILQKGAITYMKAAHPPASVADKIADADARASAQVTSALDCAAQLKDIEDGKVPPDAAALGLSASEVADAQESACDAALSQANSAVQSVQTILKGN